MSAINRSTVSGNVLPGSAARTRRHREKLRKDCTRLDVTIGADVAERLKSMSKQRGQPLWAVIEEAIDAMATATGSPGNT